MSPAALASFGAEIEKIAINLAGLANMKAARAAREALKQSKAAPRSLEEYVARPASGARPDFSAGRAAVSAVRDSTPRSWW